MWPQPECPGYPDYDRNDGVPCWQTKCGVDSPPNGCFDGTLLCQHGDDECAGNAIEACVANSYDAVTTVQFAACVESVFGDVDAYEKCAEDWNVDWSAVQDCVANDVDALNQDLGHQTAMFMPPGTPTITLNGVALKSTKDLTAQVCHAYTGADEPQACVGLKVL